eukprot:253368-Amphidinium_carterae.2
MSHTLSSRGHSRVPVISLRCQARMVFKSAATWGSLTQRFSGADANIIHTSHKHAANFGATQADAVQRLGDAGFADSR